ncbi:MAG TPA: hypothetical protein V6C99_00665 [Oculatellaceae cyanobacterium]|jgi:hypothetical protein
MQVSMNDALNTPLASNKAAFSLSVPAPRFAAAQSRLDHHSALTVSLPWKIGTHQAQDTYHCLASALPLKRYRDVPRFLLWTLRIRKQLATAAGLAGYRLRVDLLHKRFETLSAWESSEHMMNFVRSGFHSRMLVDMKGRLGASLFTEWQAGRQELPLTWQISTQKLKEAQHAMHGENN